MKVFVLLAMALCVVWATPRLHVCFYQSSDCGEFPTGCVTWGAGNATFALPTAPSKCFDTVRCLANSPTLNCAQSSFDVTIGFESANLGSSTIPYDTCQSVSSFSPCYVQVTQDIFQALRYVTMYMDASALQQ